MSRYIEKYQYLATVLGKIQHTAIQSNLRKRTLREADSVLIYKDTAFVPKFTSRYKLYIEKPLKEDNLSTRDKTAEFILVPKCPVFGGSI